MIEYLQYILKVTGYAVAILFGINICITLIMYPFRKRKEEKLKKRICNKSNANVRKTRQ